MANVNGLSRFNFDLESFSASSHAVIDLALQVIGSSVTMATVQPFQIKQDRFGGITIDTTKVSYKSEADFDDKLKGSLAKWKEDKVRGLWVRASKEHASVIPICIKHGFEFHHAQPGYVMMNMWLPLDEPNMLPQYANQYLGCAGFVVNSSGQVLVIKERFYVGQSRWKLPGGHANQGEEIGDAARREVAEETGIECEFQAVLTFRHLHNYRHGCSDFYFVCLMKPLSTDISRCTQEVADCQWMDVAEYASNADITDVNRFVAQTYQHMVQQGEGWIQAQPVLSYNKKSTNLMYSVSMVDGTASALRKSAPPHASAESEEPASHPPMRMDCTKSL